MELFIALGAIVALDLLALEFGFDERRRRAPEHHDRALEAAKHRDDAWPRF